MIVTVITVIPVITKTKSIPMGTSENDSDEIPERTQRTYRNNSESKFENNCLRRNCSQKYLKKNKQIYQKHSWWNCRKSCVNSEEIAAGITKGLTEEVSKAVNKEVFNRFFSKEFPQQFWK